MQVYIDNAATTKINKEVLNKMLPYFDEFYGNPSSLHFIGQKAKEALCFAREKIAKILNCEINELIFTSCGTEADNQAIISASKIGLRQNKKHIISTKIEHHAVLNTLKKLEENGFEITLLDVDENGLISLEELKKSIKKETCLVSVMTANNEIGTIQPIREIGQICKNNNILFHTDAVQAIGQLKIDVKDMNIDMLSLSAHKFHGPKGIGLLYFKKGIQLDNIIIGGAQERLKRAGTENIPSIVGMAYALEIATNNLEENQTKIKFLQDRLISKISKISGAVLNGDRFNRLSNNINFSFEGIDGEALLLLLNERGICASSGSACSSGSINPSHVLLAIGRDKKLAKGSIRLTLSEENTVEEIDYVIENIIELVNKLRKISPINKTKVNI